MTDWRAATAGNQRLTAILAFAERLTREPASVGEKDVERMREAGLDDEAVLHACEVASYFNYVNRMADGLGVRLEDDWDQPLLRMPGESAGPGDG